MTTSGRAAGDAPFLLFLFLFESMVGVFGCCSRGAGREYESGLHSNVVVATVCSCVFRFRCCLLWCRLSDRTRYCSCEFRCYWAVVGTGMEIDHFSRSTAAAVPRFVPTCRFFFVSSAPGN